MALSNNVDYTNLINYSKDIKSKIAQPNSLIDCQNMINNILPKSLNSKYWAKIADIEELKSTLRNYVAKCGQVGGWAQSWKNKVNERDELTQRILTLYYRSYYQKGEYGTNKWIDQADHQEYNIKQWKVATIASEIEDLQTKIYNFF